MTWSYRIIKYDEDPDDVMYFIHEVLYDENGNIESLSEDPVGPMGETEDELIADLQDMLDDAKGYPILSLSELREKGIGEGDEMDDDLDEDENLN